MSILNTPSVASTGMPVEPLCPLQAPQPPLNIYTPPPVEVGTPLKLDLAHITEEIVKCDSNTAYFIDNYVLIDDKQKGLVFKFKLWPDQRRTIHTFDTHKKVVVLKARQVGLTWAALGKALHTALFKPGVTIMLFSLGDREAMELLDRIRRMYSRLPKWLKCQFMQKDDMHEIRLSNGSEIKAFPTGRGDSYTASLAIFDEADLPHPRMQEQMLLSIQPTVVVGGQLFLISKANKRPEWGSSSFKNIYKAAKSSTDTTWAPVFLPWYARPDFTQDMYDNEKREAFNQFGNYESCYENYPESDTQALAPSAIDKRIPSDWLIKCYREQRPIIGGLPQLKAIKGLRVYQEPRFGRKYTGGSDTAEGNPNSDPSSFVLMDHLTGEEVVSMNEKLTPRELGKVLDAVGTVYNRASWLIERNNHGHAVIQWMQDNSDLRVLDGPDRKPGWIESHKSKTILYDFSTEQIREGSCIIHSFDVFHQLSQVDGNTLNAPAGEHDDLAMAFVLSLMALQLNKYARFKPEDFQMTNTQAELPFGLSSSRENTKDRRAYSGSLGSPGSPLPFGLK